LLIFAKSRRELFSTAAFLLGRRSEQTLFVIDSIHALRVAKGNTNMSVDNVFLRSRSCTGAN
jgi:hypothetical protein